MLVVHHLGISQSERIVWLCEELEIPYQLVHYERDPVTRLAPASYRALHPFGTAPVITDGDLVLGESGAIMEYVIAKHGGGRLAVAPDKANYSDYLYWFHFANGTLQPACMRLMVTGAMRQIFGQHHDPAAAHPDVAGEGIDGRHHGAVADDQFKLRHHVPPGPPRRLETGLPQSPATDQLSCKL